jgi:hypothetical protein
LTTTQSQSGKVAKLQKKVNDFGALSVDYFNNGAPFGGKLLLTVALLA